jgi:hypothetical protein
LRFIAKLATKLLKKTLTLCKEVCMEGGKIKMENKSKKQAKEEQLAKALRDNLRRRKMPNATENKNSQ